MSISSAPSHSSAHGSPTPTPDAGSPTHSSPSESLRSNTVTRTEGSDSQQGAGWRRAWDAWQEARWAAVSAPYGLAALADTAWLTPQEQPLDGLAGRWRTDAEHIVGTGLAGSGYTDAAGVPVGDTVVLAGGDTLHAGEVLLRAFVRDGTPALRRLDPSAASRVRLQGIDTFEPDAAWVRTATFTPRNEPLEIEQVDGHRTVNPRSGTLDFDLDGVSIRLTATVGTDALSVVFGDTTNGTETYRFRFLRVALPDAQGRTTVDLNRAFLPPCAFSDHYVCPLPPPGNRLDVAVTAGERLPVRTEP